MAWYGSEQNFKTSWCYRELTYLYYGVLIMCMLHDCDTCDHNVIKALIRVILFIYTGIFTSRSEPYHSS